jgi:hypothetical protein
MKAMLCSCKCRLALINTQFRLEVCCRIGSLFLVQIYELINFSTRLVTLPDFEMGRRFHSQGVIKTADENIVPLAHGEMAGFDLCENSY